MPNIKKYNTETTYNDFKVLIYLWINSFHCLVMTGSGLTTVNGPTWRWGPLTAASSPNWSLPGRDDRSSTLSFPLINTFVMKSTVKMFKICDFCFADIYLLVVLMFKGYASLFSFLWYLFAIICSNIKVKQNNAFNSRLKVWTLDVNTGTHNFLN